MYHSRLRSFSPASPRLRALSSGLTALGVLAALVGTCLPAASQDPRAPLTAPQASDGTINNDAAIAAGGDPSLGSAASVDNSQNNGQNNGPMNGQGDGAGYATDSGSAPNGDDSAVGRGGVAVPNPSVGVDTQGHANATATRNGRTNRRRPQKVANPLVITNPLRGYGPVYSGDLNSNRLAPPATTAPPRNYTLDTDPYAPAAARRGRPLPLFGYDFFQPARQIIIARRRALLPPRRVPVYRQRPYGSRLNRPGSPANGSFVPGTPSSNGYNTDSGGYNNGYNGSPNTFQNGDAAGYGAGVALGAAALGRGGVNASDSYNPNDSSQNTYSQNPYSPNDQSNSAFGTPDTSLGDTGNGDVNGDSFNPPYQSSTRGNDAGGGYDNNSNNSYSNDYANNYDSGYNSNYDSSYGNNPGDSSGYDTNGDGTQNAPRRQPRRTNSSNDPYADPYADPYSSNSYGGGDVYGSNTQTNATGSDIQFPGDDALIAGGASNATSGQIADPVATLFRNVVSSLPPNYQLQPGDRLSVRLSALTLSPRDLTVTVDPQGGINVAGIGRVTVAGRTITEAETALSQRLKRLYRNVEVSISLSQLRTIQVTVSGAAFAPGTYNVPASATAFNVLNAAGGPTASGSLRDIRVLRSGRVVGTLDIYPLLGASSARPSAKSGDINLQSGDNIYVPARLSRVTVRGEVRQPAIFELKPGETLKDVLSYSGGIKPSGVDQTVHIDTYSGVGRVLKDVNLADKPAVARVAVYDGDNINVASIRAILTNRVTIEGAVNQPGDYALTAGMHVLDLLQRAGGPLYNFYPGRADLVSLNADNTTTIHPISLGDALDGTGADNPLLKRFDRIRVYTQQQVAYLGRRQVTVRGAVQRPGLYTQSDNMHISDLLLRTGGPLPDAYLNRAVLLHQRGDGSYAYDYVSLSGVLAGNKTDDFTIQDNDVLAVYRIGEAHFTPDHTVKVLGDVVAPGLYARGDKMTLTDLLKLAGAFKPGGGTRVSIAHARRPLDTPVTQVGTRLASAAALPADTAAYDTQGVLVSGSNLTLQDGDVIAVQGNGSLREHPGVVTVTGLVNRPGPIFITSGMRLSDAIRQAGGLRPEAFPQGAEFTRMTDALITTGQSNLAQVISQMSDLLNLSQYQRERAKASLALIEAAGSAASGSSGGLAIPGLGGQAAPAANPQVGGLIDSLRTINPVSQGRILTTSQLQPNGSVAVQLAAALKHPGGGEDVILKDGDTLVVPEMPTTVQVVGAVIEARGVLYKPGEGIQYYIQRAGDFTPDAARDRIEVIHAGGGLIPASKAGTLQPGDLILVPTKVLAEKVGRSNGGFSAFFQGLVGSAITLKVLSSVFGL